jgi:sodium-dependent dicarboxylate transporter 2/3/5
MKKALLAAAACGAAFAVYWLLPAGCPESARRAAAVFVFAAFFWALEIIPLFATSLLVIVLLIFSLARPGADGTQDSYHIFLLPLSNPVIVLFLGGFVLAKMVQKYRADHVIVGHLLKLFGDKPYRVLLGFILITGFLSLWMSHTASTALMLAMLAPVLARLDARLMRIRRSTRR